MAELPRPSDSRNPLPAKDTDPKGHQDSKNLSTEGLFYPALFPTDENGINGTENQRDNGEVESPPRIGISPSGEAYLVEEKSKDLPESDLLLLDATTVYECPVYKCAEVEPFPDFPIRQPQTKKLAGVGAGLVNLSNTCFMNAVLQCLIHTVPFVSSILSDAQDNCGMIRFCPLCVLRDLVRRLFTTTLTALGPWRIHNNLNEFSKSFSRDQQEDAHEFLQCFLNAFENCYGEDGGHSHSENLVTQVFRGGLITKLRCCNCGYPCDTRESFLDLSLAIENADDLETAIQSFMKVEKIETFDCKGRCKKKEPGEKQVSFTKVPSVGIFHLKRFRSDGSSFQKIDKHVNFPLELDLLPFTVSGETADEELKYMLFAVVVHQGSLVAGHYYCFIRLAPKMWYRFDDSNVTESQEEVVLLEQAYILFYVKEGTPWFSSFIDTLPEIQSSSSSESETSSSGLDDDLQDVAVWPSCGTDAPDEASLEEHPVTVSTTKSGQPSREASLEKLFGYTDRILVSFLAPPDQESGSRKKSKKDNV